MKVEKTKNGFKKLSRKQRIANKKLFGAVDYDLHDDEAEQEPKKKVAKKKFAKKKVAKKKAKRKSKKKSSKK